MEFKKYNERLEHSEQLMLNFLGAQADPNSINKQLELWNK